MTGTAETHTLSQTLAQGDGVANPHDVNPDNGIQLKHAHSQINDRCVLVCVCITFCADFSVY